MGRRQARSLMLFFQLFLFSHLNEKYRIEILVYFNSNSFIFISYSMKVLNKNIDKKEQNGVLRDTEIRSNLFSVTIKYREFSLFGLNF